MRAIGLNGPGRALTPLEVPVPTIDDDEVLVRIVAIGVGVHDRRFLPEDAEYPYPIGVEATGIVEEVGRCAAAHRPGDRVMFVSSMQRKGGTWAEFAAVSATALVPIPDGLGAVAAAALPVAGTVASAGLRGLDLRPGQSVFVAGASGAIGTLAIQLARARGVRVAASASSKNHAYLHSLGAERAVDYRDADWPEQVRNWTPGGVDGALAIQPGTGTPSMRAVREGGRVVTVSGDEMSPERGVRVEQIAHGRDSVVELAGLAAEVAAGRIQVQVERVYPFAQAQAALEKVETGHACGKVLLVVQ